MPLQGLPVCTRLEVPDGVITRSSGTAAAALLLFAQLDYYCFRPANVMLEV